VFQALAAGAVPIYLGAANVADFVPRPTSIVQVPSAADAATGAADLAAVIERAVTDPDAAAKLLQWTADDVQQLLMRAGCADDWVCRLCEAAAHHRDAARNGCAAVRQPLYRASPSTCRT
jgi:hypothetical protein